MYSRDPFYNMIMNKIASTRIGGGHSGSSMGLVMRDMQYIAIHGEAMYRQKYILENQLSAIQPPGVTSQPTTSTESEQPNTTSLSD